MRTSNFRAARGVWLRLHLWLGLSLGVIGAVLGLSGCILLYDSEIDAWLHRQRYAISGSHIGLLLSEYARRAAESRRPRLRPTAIRLPDLEAGPVVVLAREAGDTGALQRVYLDPPSGRVLDIALPGDFIGRIHRFHESLTLRDYHGREVVGAVGIAMFVSSLTGIYLWWPGRRMRRAALGFRRGRTLSRNLHYTCGIWGVVVLATLSFTGIVLAYPDAGRAAVAAFATISTPPRSVEASEMSGRAIEIDEAVAIATKLYSRATVIGVGMPVGARGIYRVNIREAADTASRSGTVVYIDPRSGKVQLRVDRGTRTSGDTLLLWNRIVHEGRAFGATGRAVTFVGGLLPPTLMVTGLIIWLRQRRRRPQAAAVARRLDEARNDLLTHAPSRIERQRP
jgi:uncharacterized iron-regulated membrane protein